MRFSIASTVLAVSTFIVPFAAAAGPAGYASTPPSYTSTTVSSSYKSKTTEVKSTSTECSFAQKRAAIKAELDTISSHIWDDALKIPLAAGASRTFYVTANELPEVTIPVNVGVTADTVRTELVALAAVLNAGVPSSSVSFFKNKNGTVTSDFVQTDFTVLPYVHVREIHTFNSQCEITNIVGYVHGDIVCPLIPNSLANTVLNTLCTELEAAGLIGKLEQL